MPPLQYVLSARDSLRRHVCRLLLAFVSLLALISLALAASPALCATGAAGSGARVIEGRVVDESNRPIEGVTVSVHPSFGVYEFLDAVLDGSRSTHDLGITTTDENGVYRLRVEDIGLYHLVVSAPGRAVYGIFLEPLVSDRTLAALTLPRAADIHLEVEARAEKAPAPVADALVLVEPQHRRRPAEWRPEPVYRRTDDSGRATLPWPAEESWKMTAGTAELLPFQLERDAGASRRVEATLEAGEAETLVILEATGKPAAGAVVVLGDPALPVGRTDEEGRIDLALPLVADDGNPHDTLRVRVVSPEGGSLGGYLRADPDETEIEVDLQPPQPVAGRVIDLETREPVAGALVWPYGHAPGLVRSDADGEVRLHHLHSFPWIVAGASGYRPERLRVEQGEVSFALRPVTGLAGRVVDRRGAGIADAAVTTSPDELGAGSSSRVVELRESAGSAFTDGEGRFRIEGLLGDGTYDVKVRRAGYAPAERRVAFSPGEPGLRRVEIVLDPGRRGVGLVVDEANRPVAGAEVELHEPPGEMPSIRVGLPEEPVPVVASLTDEAGEYVLSDLGEGTWRLEIRAPGFAPLEIPGLEIPAFPDDAAMSDAALDRPPEIDLGVAVLVRGAVIHGRVVDADDDPVAGAAVFTGLQGADSFDHDPLPNLPQAVTGADGDFVLRDLEPGVSRRIVARKDGYLESEIFGVVPAADPTLSDDDSDDSEDSFVEIILHGPSTIRGRVLDAAGAPVASARIAPALVRDVGTSSSFHMFGGTRSAGDGSFTIRDTPPGNIRIFVDAKGYRRTESPLVRVTPGNDVDGVEIRLEEGASVSGQVLDPAGRPVAGVAVSPRWPDGQSSGFGQSSDTDAEGRFRVENLPAGSVEMVAWHPKLGSASEVLDLAAGEESHVTFEIGGGATLSGQVVTPEGDPAAGARVGVRRADTLGHHNMLETVADGEGRFELGSVKEGVWVVIAEHPDHASGRSEELEVAAAPITGLFLQLESGTLLEGEIRGLSFEELATAEVHALSPAGRQRAEVSHAGSYRLERLAPARWTVTARAGGQEVSGEVEIETGQSRAALDLDFGGGHSLHGHVLFDGAPVDGAQVVLVSEESGERRGTSTNHRGRFHLEGLDDGPHQVLVTDLETEIRHAETLELPRDEPFVVDVRTGSIFGRVFDAQGLPVGNVRVEIERADERAGDDDSAGLRRRELDTVTDPRGVFRFDSVAAGLWTIRVVPEGDPAEERTVSLEGGEEIGPLRIVLQGDLERDLERQSDEP